MSSLRQSEIKRKTNETDISVFIKLDGNGISEIDTGIPFLDHMLHQISSHGLFDLKIKAIGDTHIDDHHTNEDVGIALGKHSLKPWEKENDYADLDISLPH